jgi:hypothetical protein
VQRAATTAVPDGNGTVARVVESECRFEEAVMPEKRKSTARANPEATVALSETEIAMIDAMGILFHIAIGGRDAAGQQVAGAFDSRIQHWTKAAKPRTAGLMGLMKKLATDPKMLARRRQRAILQYAIPRGRA